MRDVTATRFDQSDTSDETDAPSTIGLSLFLLLGAIAIVSLVMALSIIATAHSILI